jgi:hypothetical protein
MAVLREGYLQRLPQRLAEIEDAASACELGLDQAEPLAHLYRLLHNLTGSAGVYGLPVLCAALRLLETDARHLLARCGPDDLRRLHEAIHALRIDVQQRRDIG